MAKRTIAILLSLVMLIGLATTGSAEEASPTGRYVEEMLDLGENQSVSKLLLHEEVLYLLGYNGDAEDYALWRYVDGTPERVELPAFPDDANVSDFVIDEAGNPIFLSLRYVTEDGEFVDMGGGSDSEEEDAEPTAAPAIAGARCGLLFPEGDAFREVLLDDTIDMLNVMGMTMVEGGFVISAMDNTVIVDAEGKLLHDFPSEIMGISAAFGDKLYICDVLATQSTPDSRVMKVYDVQSGAELESVEMPEINMTSIYSARLLTDSAGNLYLFSSDGVYRRAADGDKWELLLEGIMTILADPSVVVLSGAVTSDGQVYMAVSKVNTATFQGEMLLCTYKWSNEELGETTELNILSVADHAGLRAAISEYSRAHPEVKINYRSYVDGLSFMQMGYDIEVDGLAEIQTQVNDAISAINTEVLSGNPPDILVLDYLPIENYMSQGFLMDLSEYANGRIEDGTWTKNIANAYRQADGTLPALPTRFAVPVLWGTKSDTDQITDIASLTEFTKNLPPDQYLMMTYDITMLLSTLYPTCYMAWENEEGLVDFRSENFRQFAEMVKEMQDTLPQKSLEELQATSLIKLIDRTYAFYQDWLAGSTSQLSGQALMKARKEPVGIMAVPGQGDKKPYMPQQIVSISRNTEKKEQIYEFLDVLMGTEAQQADLAYSGYPVNAAAMETLLTPPEGDLGYSTSMSVDGVTLEVGPIEAETAAQIRAIVEGLNTTSTPDYTLLGMVLEAMRPYLAGSQSLDEMVNNLSSRTRALLLE